MPVGAGFAAGFVCLVAVVAGHAEGRTADGKDGETVEEAVWASQVGALQAPSQKDQTNDQEGQTTRRTDASQAKIEPILLLIQAYFLPIQTENFKFLGWISPEIEKNWKKVQENLFP